MPVQAPADAAARQLLLTRTLCRLLLRCVAAHWYIKLTAVLSTAALTFQHASPCCGILPALYELSMAEDKSRRHTSSNLWWKIDVIVHQRSICPASQDTKHP